MTFLIKSYADKPAAALSESTVYKITESIINTAYDNKCHHIRTNKTFTELRELLGDTLTQDTASQILQPWITAIRIAAIIEKIPIRKTREKYLRQIQHIDRIIKDLKKGIDPVESLIFFLTGNEISHEITINSLEAYKQHFSLILNLKFPPNNPLSPDKIRMHGIFSLFHLGKRLGLTKIGRPAQLRKFVQIATNKEYKDIEKYYKKYNKKRFEQDAENNPLYSFIYNPKDPIPE